MKRWFAVILLSFYLCATTEVYQFLKIPVLIEHYRTHKKDNPEMSFWAFLKLHYDNHVKDADWQEDQKLPFIAHSNVLSVICTVPSKIQVEFKPHYTQQTRSITIYNNDFLVKGVIDSIWQPPKFC